MEMGTTSVPVVIDRNTIAEEGGRIPVEVEDLRRLLDAARLLILICEISSIGELGTPISDREQERFEWLRALDEKYRPLIALSHL